MVSVITMIKPVVAGFGTLTQKLGTIVSFPKLINATPSDEFGREIIMKFFALLGIFSLVWPVVLTLIIAMATASTWAFWLVITSVVGIMQFIYVANQLIMISIDIMVLAFLKTCAVLRSQIRHFTYMNKFSKRHLRHKRNVSSIHEWKRKLKDANCYEKFTQIEIEEPFPTQLNEESTSAWWDSLKMTLKSKITQKDKDKNERKNSVRMLRQSFENLISSKKQKKIIARTKSCVNLDHATIVSDDDNRMIRAMSFNNVPKNESSYTCKNNLEKEIGMVAEMIHTTTVRLEEARLQAISSAAEKSKDGIILNRNENEVEDAISSLEFLLSGVMKRNHLNIENLLIKDSRSVVESGRYTFSEDARDLILNYNREVETCLKCLAEIDIPREKKKKGINNSPNIKKNKKNDMIGTDSTVQFDMDRRVLTDRIQVMRKLKHNMGRTALMLSGGGAQSMYHLGTIKALIESNTYDDIKVISGTSGGSITAAICALHTGEELLRHVCVPTVSTDYRLNGQMKRENIRWFPPIVNMGKYWLKNRLLVDSKEFKRCCDFYYGDVTFEEAFEKTGKHVCITVSASRAGEGSGSGVQRLLLNHISTPHVTLASAVTASSALPGVMAPAKLITKNKNGKKELFEVDGVEWIDGSVKADLPFKRISTLFNVSNFIVCQTNFHVLPFLNKEHHPNVQSLYWQIFQNCEWDIRSRALQLSRLGLFPKIFGQDMSKVFKQKYHGNLTLVPRFTTMQVFGLKSLVNPTVEDMKIYLKNGQVAAWPYVRVIKEMLRLESTIEKSLIRLEERLRSFYSDPELQTMDDVESIISRSSIRENSINSIMTQEMELMRQKLSSYEQENESLRKKIDELLENKKDI